MNVTALMYPRPNQGWSPFTRPLATAAAPPFPHGMPAATPPTTLPELVVASPLALARFVKVDGPFGPQPLDLWPAQRKAILLALRSRRSIVLKSRQLGITEALGVLLTLWESIAYPVGTDLIVSRTEDDAKDVVRRVRRMYESAPEWLRETWPVAKPDSVSEFRLRHREGTSGVLSLSSSSDAGRSRTLRRIIGDEAARWDDADERIASLLPASADIGSMTLVSTAKGLNRFFDLWTAAPGNGWQPYFVPADARPDRTAEWIATEREAIYPLGAQEYPLSPAEAFLATSGCDFDTDALQLLLDESCRPAPWRGDLVERGGKPKAVRRDGGAWQVWEAPQPGRTYVLAGDFSGGGSSADATSIVVYDAASWEQTAAFWGRPNPDQAAKQMMLAGELWASPTGPSLLVPEANNHGQSVTAHLAEQGYPRVYEAERYDLQAGGTRAGTQRGWLMNGKSKPVAISALQAGVREGTLGIRDSAAIGEMLRFSGGEASVGHDDRVISHALAAAVLAMSYSGRPQLPRVPDRPYWRPKDRKAGW